MTVPSSRLRFCLLASRRVVALTCLWSLTASCWGQNDLTDIPTPDPAAELAAMNVHEAAAVNLFASDPDIRKPIQINFDATGGLWVASSEVYPQIEPGQQANDKIIVLRDPDGDGIADSQVFAEGLLIPTGILPDGPHAAYVAESTRLLYLQDTDHDGRADKRRVVLSGFGTEDTHHLIHTLRWGPDGCVYFNQSIYIHSHVETPYGTRHLDGGGIWRYQPQTGQLEILCKGFINPWGHVFDSVGESFATDGAYFEGINYVFPNSVFVTSPGATRWLKGMNPGSPKHCGLEILSGTHVPDDWAGMLVTSDFRSHRVCRFSLKPAGSGYLSRQQPEIITTAHVAFRPIDARMGPDGALYVADWYNPIIQHGEVDFRDERRDRTSGRIWRVSFPGRELDPWPDFTQLTLEQLLQTLQDPSVAARQFTRQELWRRGQQSPAEVRTAMQSWVSEQPAERMLESLWLDEALVEAEPVDPADAIAAFDSLQPEAQRPALRSVWRSRLRFAPQSPSRSAIEQFALRQTAHSDPRVRLEAVVCAGELTGAAAFDAVLQATRQPVDDNLDFAIWQALRTLEDRDPNDSIVSATDWTGDRHGQLAYAVSAIGTPAAAETAVALLQASKVSSEHRDAVVRAAAAAGDANQLGRVAEALLAKQPRSLDPFQPLLNRTATDGVIPAGVGSLLAASLPDTAALLEHPSWATAVATMTAAWKLAEMESLLTAALPQADAELKDRLIAALGSLDSPSARQTMTQLAASDDLGTRLAATKAIAASRPRAAIEGVVELLQRDDAAADVAAELLIGMLSRKDIASPIAAAITTAGLPTDRARSLLRQVRSAGGNEELEAAIRTAGGLENAAWKLTPQLSQEILSAVKQSGSAARGEEIYRREKLQCIVCHAIGTAGGLVGPNLISIGGSAQPDYILESLIDPSAKLKEGYTTLSVLTDEGQLINGIVIGQTDEAIRLRLADGKETQIPTEAIEQEKPGKSLMPEGLVDSLTQAELVDLVAFLAALGRDPAYTVSTEPLVRSLDTLIYTPEANRRLNRTSTDTAASEDPAMNWRPLTTRVDGTVALDELDVFQQHRETPPTSFVRFAVRMPADGTVQIDVPTEGIEAWVDGKPTPVWDLQSLSLPSGDHQIVLAIDRSEQKQPFPIRLQQ